MPMTFALGTAAMVTEAQSYWIRRPARVVPRWVTGIIQGRHRAPWVRGKGRDWEG